MQGRRLPSGVFEGAFHGFKQHEIPFKRLADGIENARDVFQCGALFAQLRFELDAFKTDSGVEKIEHPERRNERFEAELAVVGVDERASPARCDLQAFRVTLADVVLVRASLAVRLRFHDSAAVSAPDEPAEEIFPSVEFFFSRIIFLLQHLDFFPVGA